MRDSAHPSLLLIYGNISDFAIGDNRNFCDSLHLFYRSDLKKQKGKKILFLSDTREAECTFRNSDLKPCPCSWNSGFLNSYTR